MRRRDYSIRTDALFGPAFVKEARGPKGPLVVVFCTLAPRFRRKVFTAVPQGWCTGEDQRPHRRESRGVARFAFPRAADRVYAGYHQRERRVLWKQSACTTGAFMTHQFSIAGTDANGHVVTINSPVLPLQPR